MGVLRHSRRRTGRGRLHGLAALGAVAVFGVAACEPGDGLSSASVAYTTDQAGTKELERRGVDVQWLSCTANYGDRDKVSTPGKSSSPTVRTVADVDCQGETKSGQDITITGEVTREVNGKCVRGDLTAKVGGKQRFRLSVLGNCDAAGTPPVSYDPRRPGATVTVTETQTIWCENYPSCRPVEGK
ncbi:hypothetical protein [Streptomyces sp. NPDC054842]